MRVLSDLTKFDNLIVSEITTAPKPTTKTLPIESEMLDTNVLMPFPIDSVIVESPPNFSVRLSINEVAESESFTALLKSVITFLASANDAVVIPNSSNFVLRSSNLEVNVSTLLHPSSQFSINVSRAPLMPSRSASIPLVSSDLNLSIRSPKTPLADSTIGANFSPM